MSHDATVLNAAITVREDNAERSRLLAEDLPVFCRLGPSFRPSARDIQIELGSSCCNSEGFLG